MCIFISNQFYAILLAIQYKKIDASKNSEKEDKFLNQNSNLRTSNVFFPHHKRIKALICAISCVENYNITKSFFLKQEVAGIGG